MKNSKQALNKGAKKKPEKNQEKKNTNNKLLFVFQNNKHFSYPSWCIKTV